MMIRTIRSGIAAFALAALVASCSDSSTSPTETKAMKVEKSIDAMCDSILRVDDLKGMIVGVWDEETGLAYAKGKGISNTDGMVPMSTDLHFRIGSNTKTFVVTSILKLADEKKLGLDDPLALYLPDFPRAEDITIRMLCNMTSGIYNFTETDEFVAKLVTEPLHIWTPEEQIELARTRDLYFEPGTGVYYSNTNTVMLGVIIEKVTGKKLEQVLREHFFTPLGLNNTSLPMDEKMPTPFVRGYFDLNEDGKSNEDVSEIFSVSWAWAAGAMVSTLGDTRKWVENLVDGTLISDSLHRQRFSGKLIPGASATYGLGMFTSEGTDMWGHNGGLPGYSSVMMHHRTKNRTIVIFYNVQGDGPSVARPEPLALKIMDLLK